jgi:putative transposase
VRYVFIHEHQKAYPINLLCQVMEVSRSSFYRFYKTPLDKEGKEEARLVVEVKALHKQSNGSYGTRRIAKGLQTQGFKVGRYRARKLMCKANVECKQRRSYKVTTRSNPSLPVAENALNRAFKREVINQVWVADITYLWTQEGWLYVAAVLDLYSRRIVGWALAKHMKEELVHDALWMALKRRSPGLDLMHHSDRGSQYASKDYQQLLRSKGIKVSMSRKGNCWDNAVMERFFGSLKSERTESKNYLTREEAKEDVINYIEMFYNSTRLHSALGYMSPLQFEKRNASLNKLSTFA